MPVPHEVAPLLTALTGGLSEILAENFVGLYAYGSVFDPTFDKARSDVDCIAVTDHSLTDAELSRLDDWLTAAGSDPWVRRLQVSFLIRESVLREDPGACLYQFGVLTRSGSDGNPIIWLDQLRRGRTLHGAAAESFLPAITPEILHLALAREIRYLREELELKPDSEWRDKLSYRVYAVLTLCRILYSSRTGAVTSKEEAARWALEHIAVEWHDLIRQALDGGDSGGPHCLPIPRLCAFVGFAQEQLDDR